MAKKDTATLNSTAQEPDAVVTPAPEQSTGNTPPAPENKPKAGGPPSGFYIYIGPTIRNLIRNNTIYRGDKAHALAETQKAIEKYPLIKTLIVSGDYLPEARLKIKASGNALHANYTKLVAEVRKN